MKKDSNKESKPRPTFSKGNVKENVNIAVEKNKENPKLKPMEDKVDYDQYEFPMKSRHEIPRDLPDEDQRRSKKNVKFEDELNQDYEEDNKFNYPKMRHSDHNSQNNSHDAKRNNEEHEFTRNTEYNIDNDTYDYPKEKTNKTKNESYNKERNTSWNKGKNVNYNEDKERNIEYDGEYDKPRRTEFERQTEYDATMEYGDHANKSKYADASFAVNDKELFGVSEQVPFDRSSTMNNMFNPGTYQSMMPMYPYGMMQTPNMQQPYPTPMPGMPSGYMNPMMGMSCTMQGSVPYPTASHYPMANPISQTIEQPQKEKEKSNGSFEREMSKPESNSKLIEELNETIRKLEFELKEANLKNERLQTESQSNGDAESRIKELEEKFRRKEMDFKITEDMLKSEIDALKKRNEVILLYK